MFKFQECGILKDYRKHGDFVENTWNQRLVLFQSEDDILGAEKQICDRYQTPLQYMISLRSDESPLRIVQSAYDITQAWKPFWDCNCTPEMLRTILQSNALVCSLISFEYLSRSNVDISEKLPEISTGDIYPATVKDLLKDARKQKGRSGKTHSDASVNYFNNCLLSMISQSGSTANPIFLPVVGALLLNRDSNRRIDNAYRSLCRALNNYDFESDTSDEGLRKRQSKLNISYDSFYNTLRDVACSVPEAEDRVDKAKNEFLKELIFHYRALSKCEQDLLKLPVRANMAFEYQISTILATLQYKCKIPLVFGADSFSFPERNEMRALGQYYDFITLTAVSYYERAQRNINEAYNLIRQCLNDCSLREFLESELNCRTFSSNLSRRDDKNILGKYCALKAKKAVECFSPQYYYSSQNCEYAMTQDDLFRICTVHSNSYPPCNVSTSNLGSAHSFDPDVGLIIFTFNSKKDKEDALAYPSILKSFLQQNFDLKSNEIAFVDPK